MIMLYSSNSLYYLVITQIKLIMNHVDSYFVHSMKLCLLTIDGIFSSLCKLMDLSGLGELIKRDSLV